MSDPFVSIWSLSEMMRTATPRPVGFEDVCVCEEEGGEEGEEMIRASVWVMGARCDDDGG